jgi:hypothetical protein
LGKNVKIGLINNNNVVNIPVTMKNNELKNDYKKQGKGVHSNKNWMHVLLTRRERVERGMIKLLVI